LGDPQAESRLGDRAEFGHRYKSTGMSQVHACLYHSGIEKQSLYVLDVQQFSTELRFIVAGQ
jgi:hypothetical protein